MGEKKEEKKQNQEAGNKDIIPAFDIRDIKEMTVEEAIKRGIMPLNPVEIAETTEEIIDYGRRAGQMYGSAVYSLISAFRRKDLPFNVRMAKASRGMLALLSMILSASDVAENFMALEESVLQEEATSETDKLIREIERLRRENKELREKLKSG